MSRVLDISRRECRPFFAGFLPEEIQRDRVARSLGVSPLNRRRVAELGESVIRKAHDVARELTVPALDSEALSRFRLTVAARAERCIASTAAGAERVSGNPTGS